MKNILHIILSFIEDLRDLRLAKKALKEQGEISWESIKKKLSL